LWEVAVGSQRGIVVRGWAAASAVVLLSGSLMACSSADAESQVERRAPRPSVDTAASAPTPAAASSPLTLPHWLPAVLPVPEDASVIAVGVRTCTVTFMDWGTDAQLAGADLSDEADANGLQSRLVSSVSEVDAGLQQASEIGGFLEEEVPVAPVTTHVVVLEMQRPAV